MAGELVLVRGAESEVESFRRDLKAYLRQEQVASDAIDLGDAQPVPRRLTEPAPLGHEAFVQIAIEIGRAVAIGVVSTVMKDLIVQWIKDQARKRGLLVETKAE